MKNGFAARLIDKWHQAVEPNLLKPRLQACICRSWGLRGPDPEFHQHKFAHCRANGGIQVCPGREARPDVTTRCIHRQGRNGWNANVRRHVEQQQAASSPPQMRMNRSADLVGRLSDHRCVSLAIPPQPHRIALDQLEKGAQARVFRRHACGAAIGIRDGTGRRVPRRTPSDQHAIRRNEDCLTAEQAFRLHPVERPSRICDVGDPVEPGEAAVPVVPICGLGGREPGQFCRCETWARQVRLRRRSDVFVAPDAATRDFHKLSNSPRSCCRHVFARAMPQPLLRKRRALRKAGPRFKCFHPGKGGNHVARPIRWRHSNLLKMAL